MTPNLARYLNKTVFVSVPALFEDGTCHAYKLLGTELNGLWLQSEELARRLLPSEAWDLINLAPVVFVPFAQIAGVLVATTMPAQPPQAATKAEPIGGNRQATTAPKPTREKAEEGEPKGKAKRN